MSKHTGRWALVWLGGDASGYEPVTYRLGEKRAESILAAAALNSLLEEETGGFDKLLVLLPETLFPDKHCEMYRLLLEAKTGYGGKKLKKPIRGKIDDATRVDEHAHRVLKQGFECKVVPHPGVASPLLLKEYRDEGKDVYIVDHGPSHAYRRPFEAMLNTVYTVLRGLASEGYSIVLDLTHSTNFLVSATLLSAAMVRSVYGPEGVETRLYMAPVMGRLSKDTEVEFIEATAAAETVNTVASGINAWEMLDERLLPLEAVNKIGSRLGPRYGSRYGRVKATVAKSGELLWSLRSGQVPLAPQLLRSLRELQEDAGKSLEEMLSDMEALLADTPWVPVADTVIASTRRLVDRLLRDRNDETMLAALEELTEKGIPDRALGPARELVVALLLARSLAPGHRERVGKGKWAELDQLLRECSIKKNQKRGNREEQQNREEQENCDKIPLTDEELAAYEKARALRNKLMHGRLSLEENVVIIVKDDKDIDVVKSDGSPLRVIERREVEDAVTKLLELLHKLHRNS